MRVLSGIQPSGKIHLGNYFGAIQRHIQLQEPQASALMRREVRIAKVRENYEIRAEFEAKLEELPEPTVDALLAGEAGREAGMDALLHKQLFYKEGAEARLRSNQKLMHQDEVERFYFIANYHSMTSIKDAALRRQLTLDVALDYLALGLDPQRSVLYRQSDVPEVNELAWLLSSVTPMGLLERCHAYKDKVAKGIPAEHGLFAYPVLMAADILIVDSAVVPVGQDQKQHIEVTRDLAQAFNALYGETFLLPSPSIEESVATVPGTDGQKMSKSYKNTIDVFAPTKELKAQVMRIVTDSTPLEDPKDPDKCNVLSLLRLFATAEEMSDWARRYRAGGVGYGHSKLRLLELIQEKLGPARARRVELASAPEQVEAILQAGARKARALAQATLRRARAACGID